FGVIIPGARGALVVQRTHSSGSHHAGVHGRAAGDVDVAAHRADVPADATHLSAARVRRGAVSSQPTAHRAISGRTVERVGGRVGQGPFPRVAGARRSRGG